ncbi:Plant self-incompatibility S1 [Arabidopsis thaliana x Arabidopsis arenosa]|uniref:Plant self-incompatibility S1 n=1 Tax=Arabidopsis thaliana x Arabidopsis arenosa TaxID=1240361 RepID=A0A8T1Y983_9BRAS|nr:Plant self-incompatibility S1 [Arabidopsis thaliana x Arabidopsis arenosa]
MSRLIFFMLVSAIYFVVNEACKGNEIVIKNQLGSSRILQYHCRVGKINLRVRHLNFNGTYAITFGDDGTERSRIKCLFRQGINMKFFTEVEVYRPVLKHPKCGLRYEYSAKMDAIYFKRDASPPLPLKWRS